MQEHLTTSRNPIRVAIDARYVREKPSGIGVYVQALVDRLPFLRAEDKFLFWAHRLARRPLSPASNTREVTVRPGPNSPWPLFFPRRYASFADIGVFHSPHNLMPRGLPCASVVTVHDVMSIERPDLHLQGIERAFKSRYYQQAVWRALCHATRLIAPTKATADRICALVPGAGARLTVIWEGADDCFRRSEDFGVAQEQAARLTGDASPYILLVGANARTKRHALAISAFAAAVPRPWRLVLLQRRKARGAPARFAKRLNMTDRIVWLDAVKRQDVVTLIQAAGALIQPSIYEGFGLPVVEAMACGCPVVASNIAPFREITGGAAILFLPNDVEKLGAALKEVVQSPGLRRSLSQQGLSRAREFSWDRCSRQTLDVYHDAAFQQR
jgi:glycosyltransferase involved in cell wall biosynthesis